MISSDDSWGGGIELAILTQEYEIEICVINTECGGRIDYFGEDRHFPYRVFLLYNNLHYDPGKTILKVSIFNFLF
jgi:ubiquitin thioesterase OTU1